jgi:prefoldin subunit 5
MRMFFRGFLAVLLVSLLAGPVYAGASVQELQNQLEKLINQVDSQKQQIETLQGKIKEMQPAMAAQAAAAAPAEVKTSSKYKLNFYGKIKFDAIYDTIDMGTDEFITYIHKNANTQDKTSFNIRETRLGIAIEGPSYNGWTPRGRFETDFYGSDANSRNGALRTRLAYIDFSKGDTSIRVGQDWNKIASLNPTVLNFAIMGYNGNLWERVPQITIQQKFDGGLEGLVTVYRGRWGDDNDGAATSTINMPWVGARVGYTGKLLDQEKDAWIALGGSFRNGRVADNDVTPYVAALEVQIPISYVEFRGEAYMGQGLGFETFHKGGAFNAEGHAILTKGGFAQLSARPMKDVLCTVGYGIDDPKDIDVANAFYQKSSSTFGNIIYTIMKDINVGIEATYVDTKWETQNEHGWRYQSSLIYDF